MRRIIAAVVCLAACAAALGAEKPIWLALTRPMFVEAVKPLAARREAQGFEAVVSTEAPDRAIAGLKRAPAFVVIVGDDQPGATDEAWFVPAKRMEFYRWQEDQRKTFASDAAWGDLDGDLAPDVPVSRMPVRTADELARLIAKIAAWEDRPLSVDDLSFPVWAGAPMYNPTVDSFATGLLVTAVRGSAPGWTNAWLISCDASSPLCGAPEDHAALFEERARHGGLLSCLIGHGSIAHFTGMGGASGYSASRAAKAFAEGAPAPPMVILSCYCGDFTSRDTCLTRALVLAPGGPVAAIGATTESHPLTNYYSGQCLLESLGTSGERRIGALWLASERRAAKSNSYIMNRILRNVEGKLDDAIDVAKLRRDQRLLYALLGDGATRMPRIEALKARVARDGNGWRWEVDRPEGASELHVGLRALTTAPAPFAGPLPRDEARRLFTEANDALAFAPVAKLSASEKWEGRIDREGTLRLVALASDRLYVATAVLRAPAPEK